MQVSARNSLKGTVKQVVCGAVSTEVMLEVIPGVNMVAVISKSSAQVLDLAEGKTVYAVVKATDVMVAIN